MPCNLTQTTTLQVSKMNLDVLHAALRSLDLAPERAGDVLTWGRGRGVYVNGVMTLTTSLGFGVTAEQEQARIQTAYTREAVGTAARRQGFKVELDQADITKLRIRTEGRGA